MLQSQMAEKPTGILWFYSRTIGSGTIFKYKCGEDQTAWLVDYRYIQIVENSEKMIIFTMSRCKQECKFYSPPLSHNANCACNNVYFLLVLVDRGQKVDAHIIIGTPGTLLDWILKLRAFDPKKIKVFVFDEADVMIATQGHQDQSIRVHRYLVWDKLSSSKTYN